MKSTDHTQFLAWKASMTMKLQGFLDGLPSELRSSLDGSLDSLAGLEEYLLVRYASPSAIREESESATLDGASRYIGEILRNGTQSAWDIDLDNPKGLYFGLPVLKGGRLPAIPACPIAMITTCLDRRTGDFLTRIVTRLCSSDRKPAQPAGQHLH